MSLFEQAPRIARHLVLPAAAAGAAGVAAYMHFVEPYWLAVTRHEVAIAALPAALDGLVVAQLSDLHLMRGCGPCDPVGQAIAVCRAHRPDLVVITGDFAGERKAVGELADVLAALRPLPAYGVFGNHEYQHGPSHRRAVAAAVEAAGVVLLNNCAVPFERSGGRLWIVGVDDAFTGVDRLDCALAGLGPADRPRILLSHYPDLIQHPGAREIDLMLSGHTHGAQINLPFLKRHALAHADSAYLSGMFQVCGVPLYVSRGLGTSGHRFRFRARPELALFTLRRRS